MKNFFLLFLATGMFYPLSAQQKASVRETVQTVKTYPFSDPDPVADPSDSYYPYFRFDGFAAKGAEQKWKVIELENDYIALNLYPEIGGKIWGAVDKTSQKEFIYHNHVVKFRDIAMRGPWTSGGIEFNFGIIGHAPTSATPVDYLIEEKNDGSVSCYIASYEWVTRTYWNVEVNLPKDKAYFTTTTTWYNQSSTDQPYYQWMNAGYKAAGNAQFVYPGNHYIGHGGELFTFPVDDKGRDLSWYKNNNFEGAKSEHVLGFYNDFYGVYWHDDQFGSVHYAPYDEKLGMKIFLWGLARDGGIWEDLLTDTDGQYVELQSGRMYNQPASNSTQTPFKHHAFQARMTDQWTEYWYPVKGIGGLSKAGPLGALHVLREENQSKLAFSPLAALSTTLRIYDGEKEVRSIPLRTNVLEPWEMTIPELKNISAGNLRIIIGDHDLVYTERPNDYLLSRPKKLPEDFDWNSAFGLYIQGEQWMNQKENEQAETYLKRSLEKEAYFAPALNRLASLYERQGRVDEALTLLNKSLSLNVYDDEANYIYGLCHFRKGQMADAKDGFSVATYSSAFRSASYSRLAEIYLKEKDWNRAIHYASRSLDYNRTDLHARQVLMIARRKTGQPEKAAEQIETVLSELPLYHFARYEKYRLEKTADGPATFTSLIRNELPWETCLEMAGWYESVGLTEEALELLACAGDYPIALYKQAYLLHQAGKENESRQALEKANALSPEMVFPFRSETLVALEWAASVSDDWKINYYRGLICWTNQRKAEALQLLEDCGEPPFASFFLTRAKLRKQMPQMARASYTDDLQKAEQLEASWRAGFAILNTYIENEAWPQVVEIGKKYMKKYPQNYYIGLKLANGYCETGQYAACINLLNRLQVLPNEGAYAGRAVYRTANLYQAIDHLKNRRYGKAQSALTASMQWPENLGVGKPYDHQIDSRLENYMQSCIDAGKGNAEKAKEALKQVIGYKTSPTYFASGNILTALAMSESGQKAEADQWVASWEQAYPGDRVAEWCAAIYKGDTMRADRLLKSRNQPEETAPWETSRWDVNFDLIVRLIKIVR
jgi:tetratricopeptide (TPR) repeat protein